MDLQKNSAGLWQVAIDGSQYEFSKWGAEEATDVLLDLAAVVGQPLGAAAGMAADKKRVGPDVVGQVLIKLTTAMGEKKVLCKQLLRKLATCGLCDGRAVVFDRHYTDRLMHMFKVVQAALEVQFGAFFGEARDALAALKPAPDTPPDPAT